MAPTALTDQGTQALAIAGNRALAGKTQHERLAGSVDVDVEHSDPRALCGPGKRKIHGDGGFADSALAGGHRHDVPDLPERLQVALHRMSPNVGLELHGERRRNPRGGQLRAERGGELRLVAADRKAERNARREPLARRAHLADRLRRAQGVLQVRVEVRVQRGAHSIHGGFSHTKTGRIQDGSHKAQVPWPLSRLWHNPPGPGGLALILLTRDHSVAPAPDRYASALDP